MFTRLNKLTNWQAAFIIAVLGLVIFSISLLNPFMGDDVSQIVNNVPVHSISNIRLFFEGGTFYNGQGNTTLSGGYFRPLMTTTFSLLYTLFGAHPLAFHLTQLLLGIGCAILLFLFFRFSFSVTLALVLSLIFLVHPLNSQTLFAIPNMQDVLYFFFGILSLWLLLRFNSLRSLAFVALCLLLSLLSKETGVLFIAVAALYLLWFDRRRLLPFLGILVLPLALYITLRLQALGVQVNTHNNPMDNLSLGGRLLTIPSIFLFYVIKFIFPLKLASAYYWTYPTFSVQHFLLPLIADLASIALLVYAALAIRKRAPSAMFVTYLFFSTWFALGMLLNLQIVPLDMTASEPWFYFPMAGLLGMIGVTLTVFQRRIRLELLLGIAVVLVCMFGLRTVVRGHDWSNQYTLAYKDVTASAQDYNAQRLIAQDLANRGDFADAKTYALRSTETFGTGTNYNTLGVILAARQDYAGAEQAFINSLKYGGDSYVTYENLGRITLVYGSPQANRQLLVGALKKFPQDSNLWTFLAIVENSQLHDYESAKYAITQARAYGAVDLTVYDGIMNNKPVTPNLTLNTKPQ